MTIIGHNDGAMGCGEYGPRRMAEGDQISPQVAGFNCRGPLEGRLVLVSSGPTHEPIAPVRYIARPCSGARGAALAEALRVLGARVSIVTEPASMLPPSGVDVFPVLTATEGLAAVERILAVGAEVFTAALADPRIAGSHDPKITNKASGALPVFPFAENPDILARVSAHEMRPQFVVGIEAVTEPVIATDTAKRLR